MLKNEPKLCFSNTKLHIKLEKWRHYKWRHISLENYFQTAAFWFSDSSLNFDEEKSIIEK